MKYYIYSGGPFDDTEPDLPAYMPCYCATTPPPDDIPAALRRLGWGGDGTWQSIDLPACCFWPHTTEGGGVWHIKESNNGTSWFISDRPLGIRTLELRGVLNGDVLITGHSLRCVDPWEVAL
jgi:hypothetical protein